MVDSSNLHRQVIHTEHAHAHTHTKTHSAAERIRGLNGCVCVCVYECRLEYGNAKGILRGEGGVRFCVFLNSRKCRRARKDRRPPDNDDGDNDDEGRREIKTRLVSTYIFQRFCCALKCRGGPTERNIEGRLMRVREGRGEHTKKTRRQTPCSSSTHLLGDGLLVRCRRAPPMARRPPRRSSNGQHGGRE